MFVTIGHIVGRHDQWRQIDGAGDAASERDGGEGVTSVTSVMFLV